MFNGNSTISGTGANPGSALGADLFNLGSVVRLQNNQQLVGIKSFGINSQFIDIIPVVTVSTALATVGEGNSIDFTFSLDEPAPSTGLTINYQIEGSATAAGNPNADHTFATGSITLAGGERSFTLSGAIIDDTLLELDETLTLRLLNGSGYTLSPQSVASVQIQDNDLLILGGTGGNDNLVGTAAAEKINGNAGNDTIDGNGGQDFIFGDAGDDLILWDSGDGNDVIDGGDGNDRLVFNCSNQGDLLIVQATPDKSLQLLRNQPVAVDLQAKNIEQLDINCLRGSDGVEIRDTTGTGVNLIQVTGGIGNDTIDGAAATVALTLSGNRGNDLLTGGSNNDTLIGGNGNDILVGGTGADILTGGAGVDTFRLALGDSLFPNFDRITDLRIGSDRIDGPTAVSAANVAELGNVASLTEGDISSLLDTRLGRLRGLKMQR